MRNWPQPGRLLLHPLLPPEAMSDVPAFSDIAEPPAGATLKLLDDRSLHIQQKTRMDFGRNLASLLGISDINMVAADSLPPPLAPLRSFGTDGSGARNTNAFSHSYAYNSDTKELAIHKDRLSSSGDFGLVCIHALSHIQVAPHDITNDDDPKFKAEFYKNLKMLSQDLYRQQSRTKKDFGSDASKEDKQAQKLSRLKKMGSKVLNVVKSSSKGNIDPEKSQFEDKVSTDKEYFSSDNMVARLIKYTESSGVSIPPDYYERLKKGETGFEQSKSSGAAAANNVALS